MFRIAQQADGRLLIHWMHQHVAGNHRQGAGFLVLHEANEAPLSRAFQLGPLQSDSLLAIDSSGGVLMVGRGEHGYRFHRVQVELTGVD